MAHSGRNLTASLLAVLLLAFATRATGGENPDAPPVLNVRLMSWQGDITNLLVGKPKPDATPLTAPDFGLSEEIAIVREGPAAAAISIFKQAPADGTPDRAPALAATVPIPATLKNVILLLAPAPAGSPSPLSVRLIDNSPEAHPEGSIRVLNFSAHQLALRIGPQSRSVDRGADQLFSYAGSAAPRTFFQLAAQSPEGWKMLRRFLLPTPPGSRLLCIVRDGRISEGTLAPGEKGALVDAVFISQ